MARFLERLVNEGIKVIASTHSDYITREINTLIMLSSSNKKSAELRERYGYSENKLLKPAQIEVLLFIAFQINILAERPDRFWKPVRSENFYFSEKL